MEKLYNVQITAVCNVAIFAESESEALEGACDAASYGDFTMTTGGPAELIEDEDDHDGARESYIRHADVLLDSNWHYLKKRDALALIGVEA